MPWRGRGGDNTDAKGQSHSGHQGLFLRRQERPLRETVQSEGANCLRCKDRCEDTLSLAEGTVVSQALRTGRVWIFKSSQRLVWPG